MHRSPTARLFVAVNPPEDVCEQLAAWARTAVRGFGRGFSDTLARVLDPANQHVTLLFIGDRPTDQIDALARRLQECDEPMSSLSVGAPVWLPPRHPRALAVEIHDEQGRLAALQRAVEQAGAESSEQPSRPVGTHHRFRPHVTVARTRPNAAGRAGMDRRLLPATPPLAFLPSELVLYRSWLSPEGASYEPLATVALESADRPTG